MPLQIKCLVLFSEGLTLRSPKLIGGKGDRLQFLQRFQRDLGLELGTLLLTLLGHVVTSVSVDCY